MNTDRHAVIVVKEGYITLRCQDHTASFPCWSEDGDPEIQQRTLHHAIEYARSIADSVEIIKEAIYID
jgi:hypothetical protein